MSEMWPQADVGNIARLRALVGAFPGAVVRERLFSASFDTVWGYFSDMEISVPAFDKTVSELRIAAREGTRLVVRARNPSLPVTSTLDVDLEAGWCLMTARPAYYLVAFAAEPAGTGTRFAHAEAVNVMGPRAFRLVFGAMFSGVNRWVGRHAEKDLEGLGRALGPGD